MSKEKQIEEMARIICRDYNGGICATDGFVCNYNCEWTQIAKHLYNEGYRKSEWISVDERLPEKDGKYLCYMLWKNGTGWFECLDFGTNLEKASGCFDGVERSGFYYFDPDWGDVETKEVTHWMPLPEAPKMKGGE